MNLTTLRNVNEHTSIHIESRNFLPQLVGTSRFLLANLNLRVSLSSPCKAFFSLSLSLPSSRKYILFPFLRDYPKLVFSLRRTSDWLFINLRRLLERESSASLLPRVNYLSDQFPDHTVPAAGNSWIFRAVFPVFHDLQVPWKKKKKKKKIWELRRYIASFPRFGRLYIRSANVLLCGPFISRALVVFQLVVGMMELWLS